MTVMVVDDAAVQLELFHRLINGMPDMICNQSSNDGRRALAILEDYKPDVLLISHMQDHPHGSGIALVGEVCARYPDLPVVFYAGPHAQLKAEALEAGAAAVIGMPLQLSLVVTALRQAVKANIG